MIKKIFTKERLIWLLLLVVAVCTAVFFINRYNCYENKWKQAVENNKAYALQLDKEKAQSNVFKLTAEQLNYYNDSITALLNLTRKELNIKDKQLSQLQYISSEMNKRDTVTFTDTIFKEPDFSIDTNIGDRWIATKLHMEYPNVITLNSKVTSEKTVVMYMNKETVEPPKKFFLCRWFQKKHTVLKAVVKENNPYVTNQENVFYEIIK